MKQKTYIVERCRDDVHGSVTLEDNVTGQTFSFVSLVSMIRNNKQVCLSGWFYIAIPCDSNGYRPRYTITSEFRVTVGPEQFNRAYSSYRSDIMSRRIVMRSSGSKRPARYQGHRRFSTLNEKKQAASANDQLVMAGLKPSRRRSRLPDAWEDINRQTERGWKHHRRKQYK